ncbi:MAG: nucleotidyltransferase domain-containing protein [Defluviitaleaceae bacterium]|nr:nucleotidyltransferase domain-containing protein [Defluviitaleaceae bacterium]
MQKWEMAARDFVDNCSFKSDIDAVILTGNYASGNADEFSDVDLDIVLNDNVDWRERGNKRVNGFLIEYFANPVRQIKKYIDDAHNVAQIADINMLLSGIVLFDKNNTVDELIKYCKQKLAEDFPKMSEFHMKMGLYHLWDSFDELGKAYATNSADFTAQFWYFVKYAFEFYSRYKCCPVPNFPKLYRWLTDDSYFNKYGYPVHKDEEFVQMIKRAFECVADADEMHDLTEEIYHHIVNNMGGFDINDFDLRGRL